MSEIQSKTRPLGFENAEQCRRAIIAAFSNVLDINDQQLLAKAIQEYGNMRVMEFRNTI